MSNLISTLPMLELEALLEGPPIIYKVYLIEGVNKRLPG
jgi:hypothetical protein